jgi:phage FluMu protein Com
MRSANVYLGIKGILCHLGYITKKCPSCGKISAFSEIQNEKKLTVELKCMISTRNG